MSDHIKAVAADAELLVQREQQLYSKIYSGVKQELDKQNLLLSDSKQDREIAVAVKKVIEKRMAEALRPVNTTIKTSTPEEVT